jgi:hypothetical protein
MIGLRRPTENRAESREQRAESREQRAESREQRAESREQRAERYYRRWTVFERVREQLDAHPGHGVLHSAMRINVHNKGESKD